MRMSSRTTHKIAWGLCWAAAAIVLSALAVIIVYIFVNGIGVIDWEFLSTSPIGGMRGEGGILSAIVGTIYLVALTVVIATPLGLLAGLYLAEYARDNWLTRAINMAIINLAGVPSIVYGLFGLGVFVLMFGFGYSLLSASFTLACQALAMTITTAREAILAVPREYREGSLAVGATKWQTVKSVVLPQAMPGIITGSILAMSRAAGETAPILVVGAAFLLPGLPQSPFDQFMALPYHLYTVAAHVPGMPESTMWGVALVLLVVVLSFNILATIIRLRARRRRYSV